MVYIGATTKKIKDNDDVIKSNEQLYNIKAFHCCSSTWEKYQHWQFSASTVLSYNVWLYLIYDYCLWKFNFIYYMLLVSSYFLLDACVFFSQFIVLFHIKSGTEMHFKMIVMLFNLLSLIMFHAYNTINVIKLLFLIVFIRRLTDNEEVAFKDIEWGTKVTRILFKKN